MLFGNALKLMKQGEKVKLPSWGGYWYWDEEKQTVMIHTKEGKELDIRETEVVEYTLSNVCSDEWVIADENFCMVAGKADDAMELVNAVSRENEKLELNQFKKATELAAAWLMENGNPHQRIIIEMGGVELVSGEMAYPTEIPD